MAIMHTYEQSILSTAPAIHGTAVTPSDSEAVTYRSLWVGGVGNVAVMFAGDSVAVTITAVAAGTLLPFAVRRVMSTNTTATLIIGVE